MRNRISVGFRASDILRLSFLQTKPQLSYSLRPFSSTSAREKSPKLRTRFSGPQPDKLKETLTYPSLKGLDEGARVLDPKNPVTPDSSSPEGSLISFEQIHPFPDQDLSSTRPAPLETPAAPQREDHGGTVPIGVRFSYLYHLGRAYGSFYKTGLKNVWHNYKEYRKIKERLGPYHINDVVKYGGRNGLPTISRREYQLCLRTRHDIRKLVPFSLIFLICGEFTPLVVLALGSAVVPATCRIPKQVTKDNKSLVKRVIEARTARRELLESNSALRMSDLEAEVGYVWGLMPSPRPLPLFHSLLRPRVVRRAEELLCDTILVRREGGPANMNPPEALDFLKQASPARFLVQRVKEKGRPLKGRQTEQKLKELQAPLFEPYLDAMLQELRISEHNPKEHYVAALRY